MNDQESAKSPKMQHLMERLLNAGFLVMGTLCAVMFLLEGLGWARVSAPQNVLIVACWCPFFWVAYAMKRKAARWTQYLILLCAVVVTATLLAGAITIMIRLVR